MQVGAVFPQTEIGNDPIAIRDWAQAVEEMGFAHILPYDHVLGASTASRPDWSGPYTTESAFHEVFVLLGYLAGLTRRVELTIGVLVLPQRQTVLVAKQAAAVDVLSGGRLRLGVGVGWNAVEFEALGEDFHNRGVRSEEQIAVLRALWTEPAVTFRGRWHTITDAGLNPLPVQRPIPIWIGGYTERTLQRIARLGDGWYAWRPPNDEMRATLERLRAATVAAGRSPEAVGINGILRLGQFPQAEWAGYADRWRALGATELSVNTMGESLASPQAHIDRLREVKATLGF